MKKILHITNWYPYQDSLNGNFIQRHFWCAKNISDSELVHIQATTGKFSFRKNLDKDNDEKYFVLTVPIKSYKVLEIITFSMLVYVLFTLKLQKKNYDLYVFHIAYPLLRYAKLIKKIINKPMAILEHWSAYKHNFYLPEGAKSKHSIEQIFHHNIPLVTVSQDLQRDIINFAKYDRFDKYNIPNVVDETVFYPKDDKKDEKTVFLMVANWSSTHKRLMLGVKAFVNSAKKYNNIYLRIVGNGEQLETAKEFLNNYPYIFKRVYFIGQIEYEEVGNEMRNANVFLHPTNMETFSLVCVEALFCNIPVIASNVPVLPMHIKHNKNGLLVDNVQEKWDNAIEYFLENRGKFKNIGKDARSRFSSQAVSQRMREIFDEIIQKWDKNAK